jgi:hypothetical protein
MNHDYKVIDVLRFLKGYDKDSVHAIQQFLHWFGGCRKLERIVWSGIKKTQNQLKELAEYNENEERRYLKAKKGNRPYHPPVEQVREPQDISLVVGKCPKCGSNLLGMPVKGCGKAPMSSFGNATFYKECSACTYYSEIFERKNRYKEVEGG